MLIHLFSSRTRTKLLTLFLKSPQKASYVRELERKIRERINSIRRELANLTRLGLISPYKKQRKKYFQVNRDFVLFRELRDLILKAETLSQGRLARQIKDLGSLKLVILTKSFLQPESKEVDLLLVGKVKRKKLEKFIKHLERQRGREINFTVLDQEEFEERKRLKDGFLEKILGNEYMRIL